MKASILGLVLIAGTAGCSGGKVYDEPNDDAACPSELILNGQKYDGTGRVFRSTRGQRIGSAHFTGCDDGHGGEDPDTEVPAFQLPGTELDTAFLAEMGGDYHLFTAEDVEDPCSIKAARC